MAAGLRPDPLGELKRSPDPLAAIRGPTSKGREREGRGKGREKGKGGTCCKVLGGIDAPGSIANLVIINISVQYMQLM